MVHDDLIGVSRHFLDYASSLGPPEADRSKEEREEEKDTRMEGGIEGNKLD